MKELDLPHQDNTVIQEKIHADAPIGKKFIPRGVRVWEINPETEEIKEFKPKISRVVSKEHMDRSPWEPQSAMTHHKVEYNPNLYYNMAINEENALRKFYKSKFYEYYRRKKQASGNTQ